jgi:hypothetical protein
MMTKNPPIYILSTCRKIELLRAATLVFDTLRIGFPDSQVHVWTNSPMAEARKALEKCALRADCEIRHIDTIHHRWIEMLVGDNDEPFWICDTDVIFWNRCDLWNMQGKWLSGCLTPGFYDRFTRCKTMPRLHTSLLYIDPERLRLRLREWRQGIHFTEFNPAVNLYYPLTLPPNTFYDTCSLLYQAVGGSAFSPAQLACYEHLHCATWVDLIEPTYPGMKSLHESFFERPDLARGLRDVQSKFYAANAI